MSAIAYDFAPAAVVEPTAQPALRRRVRPREEEFRLALAAYMAGYAAEQQGRRAEAAGSTVARLFGWMRGGRG